MALALSAATVPAQKPSAPLPKPDTPPPVPPILQDYKPVTAERLKQPEDGDWLMYRRTYDSWGYSPLSQITPDNAARLKPVWTLQTGQIEGHEAPPMVNNGVMFVATPGNQVLAIDARKGDLLWRFKRPIPEDILLLHPTSRGVGLLGNKVYFAAADAVLVALDAKTGNEVWNVKVEDYTHGYYMSLAPLVADGKVMVGVSGGELGVRGFVEAFDAETGKSVWKTYAVPAPGEPGSETWPSGDQWKTGGASVWITGSYDPETNLTFWGTGNGGPWMGDQRPGDNFYTSSTIALDTATGKIKGYFQYHPNDSWDWDEVNPPILVDYRRNGRTVKGLVYVARDGYLWMLERDPDKINFIDGKPFVKQNVFKSLDPKTGRPDVDPARQPGTGKKVEFCPSLWGGKDWPPVAYSPKTRLLYVPANENLCAARLLGRRLPIRRANFIREWQRQLGCSPWFLAPTTSANCRPGIWIPARRSGTSLSPTRRFGGRSWRRAGGVLFMGGTNDRYFRAFDASNGKTLWEFRTGSGVNGVPVSFAASTASSTSPCSRAGASMPHACRPASTWHGPWEYPDVPQGGSVWVFALD